VKASPEPEFERLSIADSPVNLSALFEIASGSVMGRYHLLGGKNNQDAYDHAASDAAIVAVVCDGCGSCQNSEVGAKLGAKLVVNTLSQMLVCPSGQESELQSVITVDKAFWKQFKRNLKEQLGRVAIALAGFCPDPNARFANQPQANFPEIKQVITDYLLFTIVGALITPETTTIFSIGDGLVCLNEKIIRIGPYPGNAPPYIAYALLDAKQGNNLPSSLTIHAHQPTASVNSILLGTDGVCDLIAAASHKLPGRHEEVGKISQFWQSDHYFYNRDLVRRKLSLANQEGVKPDWQTRRITKQPGLLPDDTTLIAIRRVKASSRGLSATEDHDATSIQIAENRSKK
jgi:hypothetical protein